MQSALRVQSDQRVQSGGRMPKWLHKLDWEGNMFEGLRLEQLINLIQESFRRFSDVRTGQNRQSDLVAAGMGAFSVFFTQSPSFLAYQEDLKRRTGKSNAESLFGMEKIPSDNQIRALLDTVDPSSVASVF
jgi:hypothetical protein